MPSTSVTTHSLPQFNYLDKVGLGLWALLPILFPIYLFNPGKPQISSVVIAGAGIVGLVAGYRLPPRSRSVVLPLGWFLWYVCLVNVTWAAISENPSMVRPPMFFLYNGFVVLLCLWFYGRAGIRFLKLTQHAMAISVLLQLFLLFFGGPTSARESIYFDNPNQLGYFALAMAAGVLMIADRLNTSTWYRGSVMGICFFLIMVSSSFAAIGGFALLVILALKSRPGMLILMALAFVAILSVWEADLFLGTRIENETEEMEGVSFWASRGYDRIFSYPEHVFLGSGEGNYRDYESAIGKHEIHSSYGTLLFCYGIIGSLLFLWFLFSLARAGSLRYFQYVVPVLIYGGAHQGLRFTMLWMVLALVYCVGDSRKTGEVTRTAGHRVTGGKRRALKYNSSPRYSH